ncbi:MAG TPA: IS200/IS605 family transposase [Leptolyngbyaceae cyanobacterium]
MSQTYRHKNTSVSLVNYHLVWIVRRRRRVLTGSIKQRLDVLIYDTARELDCDVLNLAIEPEHIHLFINAPPNIAPSDLMHRIKGRTARMLRQEFPELMKLPSMWTRAYFVSTAGNVSSSTIQKYIDAQGKD